MEALKTDITGAAVTAVKRALADVDPARAKDAAREFKMWDGIADRIDKLDARESPPLPLRQIEPWARDDDRERILAGLRPFRDRIRAYQTNRSRRPILAPPRADPLTRRFIECLGAIWFVEMGKPPGASRQGPFVRLLTGSWRHLGFKAPVDDDNLEAWLGRHAEHDVTKCLKGALEQTDAMVAVMITVVVVRQATVVRLDASSRRALLCADSEVSEWLSLLGQIRRSDCPTRMAGNHRRYRG
jgi:hypothetical protein